VIKPLAGKRSANFVPSAILPIIVVVLSSWWMLANAGRCGEAMTQPNIS
jgi:hypothetical protein